MKYFDGDGIEHIEDCNEKNAVFRILLLRGSSDFAAGRELKVNRSASVKETVLVNLYRLFLQAKLESSIPDVGAYSLVILYKCCS